MRVIGLCLIAAAALAVVQAVSPLVQAQNAAPQADAAAPLVDAPLVDDAPLADEAPQALEAPRAQDEGTLIQIGPDGGVEIRVDGDARQRRLGRRLDRQPGMGRQPGFVEAPQAVSRYWIGLGGGPLPVEFRAQLDIGADEGILVRTVAPDGPAAEAGVQQFDILLRANGKPINDLTQLADEVGEQGEMKGRITLDLLRRGKPETLWVTPIERPLDAVIPAQPRRERLGLFARDGLPLAEGLLGEGGLVEGELGGFAEMIPQMVSGVSVSVTRQNDGPAQVTVTSGDKTWEFNEGDQEAIAALPDDVRPTVERMLQRNGGVLQPGFEGFGINAPGVQVQLNGLEATARMRALQERLRILQGRAAAEQADPVAPPMIELDEAPAFGAAPEPAEAPQAEVEGPVELEIPAVEK